MTTQRNLRDSCVEIAQSFDKIPPQRRKVLDQIADYIFKKQLDKAPTRLIVICTHNSRRSHIGQLWLQAGAQHFGVPNVEVFSGGTEATAFHPNAVAALRRAGFDIEVRPNGENPTYRVHIPLAHPMTLHVFSKKFDQPPNPTKDFAAIMVCSEADAGCPFVPGAEARFAVPFEDPKRFDGTPEEAIGYDESVYEIGRAFLYVMARAVRKV